MRILYLTQQPSRSSQIVRTSRRKCGAGRFPDVCRKVFPPSLLGFPAPPLGGPFSQHFPGLQDHKRPLLSIRLGIFAPSFELEARLSFRRHSAWFASVFWLTFREWKCAAMASTDFARRHHDIAKCSVLRQRVQRYSSSSAAANRSFIVRAAVVRDPASTFTRERALLGVPAFVRCGCIYTEPRRPPTQAYVAGQ